MEADRTILFADICDSTGITEAIGDVESRRHFSAILAELTALAAREGGTLVKTIGDEVMCSFEQPQGAFLAAVEMQRAMTVRPALGGIPAAIKIGVHGGSVILEHGDVFGDVVNVAARVISLAAAEQILTTAETMDLVGGHQVPFRSLGTHQVRGRDEELHLCEVLWRGETSALTAIAPKLDTLPTPEMEFRMGDRVLSMTHRSTEPITLGRAGECSLVVPGHSASRAHARIVRRGPRFYLEDHSANGTYVKPSDGNEIFVHRDQVLLQGSGRIRLGEPVSIRGPLDIEFVTVYPDPAGGR